VSMRVRSYSNRKYMKKKEIFLCLFIFQTIILFGQKKTEDYNKIDCNFRTQLGLFPQEKIHLHTDRDFYVPGENIWFKAYLTDAATHQHSTQSRYVYVELISPVDTLIRRVMIRPENGMFYGNLFLSELIPEGNYTIRAYTRFMDNLGDDFFFKKNIRIGSLTAPQTLGEHAGSPLQRTTQNTQPETRNTQRATRNNDFDVSFFPEGGNLVEGIFNTVAFKALNRNGYPEMISGIIVDENNVEITPVQTFHAGMGVFSYIPIMEKRYWLKCRNANGLDKQFELPQPGSHVYTLTASQQNRRIFVGVRKAIDAPNIPCFLLAHCRGTMLYFDSWDSNKEYVVFDKDYLLSGVIQFILFDELMNPLSERLVFNKIIDKAKVEYQTDKKTFERREKVISTLSLTDSEGNLLDGNLSIAITDDMDMPVDSSTTILSSLLLSSELKGYIENPAYYLLDNTESVVALDYLMMTHGWRRYNIPEVVKGNLEIPQIPFQASQQISGKVRGLFFMPIVDSEVLIISEEGDYGTTSTDEKGTFMFQNFEYPDSTSFMIQAISKRGSSNVELVLNGESFPKLIHAPQSPVFVETDNYTSQRTNVFIEKVTHRARYDEDMQVIHLSEIIVTAQKIDRKDERRLEFWMNRSSDKTIRREDIEKKVFVTDALRGIAGVNVSDNGSVTFRWSELPDVYIDGIKYDWPEGGMFSLYESPLEIVPVSAVESIDIIKGVSGTLFGIRGANGAISITTRMVEDVSEKKLFNYSVYTPLGYQKPVEFYSPVYETLDSKHKTIPDLRTTIFWKPDIVISEDEEKATFEFYTSDFPTTYSVVIEGLTSDGRVVRQVEKIRVE